MTTLAIIGGGIAGKSLLYTLKKTGKKFDKIFLFYSDSFAPTCSLRSTAIVAPRGVSAGVSALGDLLHQSFAHFSLHVESDRPEGVTKVKQYTGAMTKLDQFQKRYPHGQRLQHLGTIRLGQALYVATEDAYMIDPELYLAWLIREVRISLPLVECEEFVTQVEKGKRITLKTNFQREYQVDELMLAAGAASRFWKGLSLDKKWQSSKAVQGSYLQFDSVSWDLPSFSLTLEGDNLIYDCRKKRLLIGSTTHDSFLQLAPIRELEAIYQRLKAMVDLKLPPFEAAEIKLGLREKASKREPYLITEENVTMLGGLYKNGFSAGLYLAQQWVNKR